MLWRDFLLVAAGGAIGSVLRYGCTLMVAQLQWHPTIATLIVNIAGSFVIGLLIGCSLSSEWKAFATVGLCGGFTTFSTFSSQTADLLRNGAYLLGVANVVVSVVVCVVAAAVGVMLTNKH